MHLTILQAAIFWQVFMMKIEGFLLNVSAVWWFEVTNYTNYSFSFTGRKKKRPPVESVCRGPEYTHYWFAQMTRSLRLPLLIQPPNLLLKGQYNISWWEVSPFLTRSGTKNNLVQKHGKCPRHGAIHQALISKTASGRKSLVRQISQMKSKYCWGTKDTVFNLSQTSTSITLKQETPL